MKNDPQGKMTHKKALSLYPLSLDEALTKAMMVPPPQKEKVTATKKPSSKK